MEGREEGRPSERVMVLWGYWLTFLIASTLIASHTSSATVLRSFLVYRCDVETLSPCYVVVPLSSDFGLVCNENPFAVWSRVHWVDFDVEVEVGEGLDVFLWPVTEVHEPEHGVLANVHLPLG